ncbi:hypothetical protein P280DRAFT_480095 [Massarina eburnea CBS 473.64]|uniref:Uncharacterized protein n=1 Tax=Massarina eburnea CBS 473.64 TaxID=1395130 RepID=A0A6A6RZP5_9PLEO|nr:hypothetical protein P280DRAFT_480095 [Massarina eburnea CBS 473.64]
MNFNAFTEDLDTPVQKDSRECSKKLAISQCLHKTLRKLSASVSTNFTSKEFCNCAKIVEAEYLPPSPNIVACATVIKKVIKMLAYNHAKVDISCALKIRNRLAAYNILNAPLRSPVLV